MQSTIMNYGWWRAADVGKVSGGGGRRRGAGTEWEIEETSAPFHLDAT